MCPDVGAAHGLNKGGCDGRNQNWFTAGWAEYCLCFFGLNLKILVCVCVIISFFFFLCACMA